MGWHWRFRCVEIVSDDDFVATVSCLVRFRRNNIEIVTWYDFVVTKSYQVTISSQRYCISGDTIPSLCCTQFRCGRNHTHRNRVRRRRFRRNDIVRTETVPSLRFRRNEMVYAPKSSPSGHDFGAHGFVATR